MNVRLVDKKKVPNFDRKCSTEYWGRWIEIRNTGKGDSGQRKFVGNKERMDPGWPANDPESDPGIIWPEAMEIVRRFQ